MPDVGWFLDSLQQWTAREECILATALVGSFARGTATDDSDIDLILITEQPHVYLQDNQWLEAFGHVLKVGIEDWGLVQSKRAFYEGNLEVEFGITTPQWAATNPLDSGTRRVLADGVRVLSDRFGLLSLALDVIRDDSRGG